MSQRILSFFVLWIVLGISLLVFGVHAGILAMVLLAFFTQLELYQLFDKMGLKPIKSIGLAAGVIVTFGAYYLGDIDSGNDLFILSFIVLALIIIRLDLQAGRLRSFIPTLFGLFYIPFLMHFLIKIVKLAEENIQIAELGTPTGVFLTVWLVAVAKCADVGGLLVGMRVGKTPLSIISPKKTYEGAVGGIIFSMIVGIILAAVFHKYLPETLTLWRCALIAILISIASIASDLVESAFKRQAGVKDSGKIIPGIGGIFDLTDSLILASPLGYLLFKFMVFS